MDLLCGYIARYIQVLPASIWPMVFFPSDFRKCLLAVLVDIFQNVGVDYLGGQMASIIQGSTDTTLYVITLYFSSVGIKKIKNALSIGLIADAAGTRYGGFVGTCFFKLLKKAFTNSLSSCKILMRSCRIWNDYKK